MLSLLYSHHCSEDLKKHQQEKGAMSKCIKGRIGPVKPMDQVQTII